MIDIIEQDIINISEKLFDTLIKDRTTQKNICWATDYYIDKGTSYFFQEPITKNLVTGINIKLIRPRVAKELEEIKKQKTEQKFSHLLGYVMNKII